MRGCLTLMVLIAMAGSAIVAVGASFLYVLALAVAWLVLVVVGKVFSKREEADVQQDEEPVSE